MDHIIVYLLIVEGHRGAGRFYAPLTMPTDLSRAEERAASL